MNALSRVFLCIVFRNFTVGLFLSFWWKQSQQIANIDGTHTDVMRLSFTVDLAWMDAIVLAFVESDKLIIQIEWKWMKTRNNRKSNKNTARNFDWLGQTEWSSNSCYRYINFDCFSSPHSLSCSSSHFVCMFSYPGPHFHINSLVFSHFPFRAYNFCVLFYSSIERINVTFSILTCGNKSIEECSMRCMASIYH